MALLLGKHFYFLSFLQFTFMCAKKRINKMHSSQHLFYRNKSTLFFARFYQQKPVSKLIYLVVMGWVQCSSQQMLQKYLCKKILFFAESDWKLWQTREMFLNNYIPHKRGQLWKVRRQACIVVYSLLFGGCQFWKPQPFSRSKSIKLLYDCKKSFPLFEKLPMSSMQKTFINFYIPIQIASLACC